MKLRILFFVLFFSLSASAQRAVFFGSGAPPAKASAPSCTPTNGPVPQTVTCTNPNAGTTVMCYAVSPTTPATNGAGTACSTGTAYTTPFTISSPETLNVRAGVASKTDSVVVSYTYTATSTANLGYNPAGVGTHGCLAGGTCYYIDWTNGADTNNGTAKGTAWKHAPGMTGATSNAASHSVVQTDEFILKGGEVWPYAAVSSGWAITIGGVTTTPNAWAYPGWYLGYDPTWNDGIVNSVRVTDPGNCATGTTLTVQFSGGGGSSAAATANMEKIDSFAAPTLLSFVTMTNQGSSYTSNPTVGFTVTAGSCSRTPVAYADIYSPVISAAGTTMGTSSNIPIMFLTNAAQATIDHLEFAHDHIYSSSNYTYAPAPNMLQILAKAVNFENNYVHDMAYASVSGFNTFCVVGNACQQIDTAQSAALYYGNVNGVQGIINNNVFNNYESEAGGCAAASLPGTPYSTGNCVAFTAVFTTPNSGTQVGITFTNNIVNNWRGGLYTTGQTSDNLVAGNRMWAGLHDTGNQHGDTYYLEAGGLAYNNILQNIYSGTAAFYTETGDGTSPTAVGYQQYLFNNVCFDIGTSTPCIGWTSEYSNSGATNISPVPDMRSWNNTFVGTQGTADCENAGQWFGASPTLAQSKPFAFTLYNQHCITTQAGAHWYNSNGTCNGSNGCGTWNGHTNPNSGTTQALIDPQATVQTLTTATSQGYTPGNLYAPTLSSNDTVTFAAGGNSQNLTSLCSTSLNGLSLANLCSDILGNARPSGGGWQAGAYMIAASATAPTVITTTATGVTQTTATAGGVVTTNGGAAVTSEGTCYAVTANPTTPCTSDGTATPFTSNITGLTANTTYHYRAFAMNSVGTGYGSDETLTTASGGGGAPLTYAARTDPCELGTETGCLGGATGTQGAKLSYLGRQYPLVSFTTDGSSIPTFVTAANTFVNGQTVKFQWATESWLNSASVTITGITNSTHFTGTALAGHANYTSAAEPVPPNPQAIVTDALPSLGGVTGKGNCITDPDFGSRICRITDYTNFNSVGRLWNLGSDGAAHRFSADSPPSMLMAQNSSGNNAIITLAYSGSGATWAVTPTLSALAGNSSFPGAAYTFSVADPHILWELVEQGYDWTHDYATSNPANTCNPPDAPAPGSITPTGGITCEFMVQLNKLTMGCIGGPGTDFPYCTGGVLGITNRAKAFEFNCLGASCPTTSANENMSGGVNLGTDSHNCLPFNFAADWNGIFLVSDDDTSMTTSFSDDGQAGKWQSMTPPPTCTAGATKGNCLGASKLVNWTLGKGCRVLDTHYQTVAGDWGTTGTTLNGQPNVISGTVGAALPEIVTLHEGEQTPDAAWAVIGAGTNPSCASDSRTPATVTGWKYNIGGGTNDGLVHVITDVAHAFVVGQQVDFTGATGGGYTWINNGYYTIGSGVDSTHFVLTSIPGHTTTLSQSADFTVGKVKPATSAACSCAQNGSPFLCNAYYWHIADTTVNPCGTGDQSSPCQGHNARGYVNDYRGKYYVANSHDHPTTYLSATGVPSTDADGVQCPTPDGIHHECALFPNPFPGGQSGTYQNHGLTDQTPVALVVQNSCGVQGAQGSQACDPQFTAAGYNELEAGENYVQNPDAKHCAGSGCDYRFAHTGNGGDSWNFNVSEAISIISKDGSVIAFPSDWGHSLGCTDGTAGPCLSALQATAPANETVNSWSTDSGGLLTVITSAAVKFVVGSRLNLSGSGYPSWLTSPTWLVAGVSGNNFTVTGGTASQSGGAGTATGVECSTLFTTTPCQRADLFIVNATTAHQ